MSELDPTKIQTLEDLTPDPLRETQAGQMPVDTPAAEQQVSPEAESHKQEFYSYLGARALAAANNKPVPPESDIRPRTRRERRAQDRTEKKILKLAKRRIIDEQNQKKTVSRASGIRSVIRERESVKTARQKYEKGEISLSELNREKLLAKANSHKVSRKRLQHYRSEARVRVNEHSVKRIAKRYERKANIPSRATEKSQTTDSRYELGKVKHAAQRAGRIVLTGARVTHSGARRAFEVSEKMWFKYFEKRNEYYAKVSAAYRKGLSGEEANDGRMQRRINKAARASGRKVSETRQKKRGEGGFALRERGRRSSTNIKETTLPRNASDKRQRATRSFSRQPLVLEGRLPDGRYWYVPAPTSQARRS